MSGSHSSGVRSALGKGGRPDSTAPDAAKTATGPSQSEKPPWLLLSPTLPGTEGNEQVGTGPACPLCPVPRSGQRNRTIRQLPMGLATVKGAGCTPPAWTQRLPGPGPKLRNRLPQSAQFAVPAGIWFAPVICTTQTRCWCRDAWGRVLLLGPVGPQ